MRIAVLCGGVSTEREVSLRSGDAVAHALTASGVDAFTLDVESIASLVDEWPRHGADVAFVALHGGWGEDGRIQAAMASRGIKYTGSGPDACRLAMRKHDARAAMERAGAMPPPGAHVVPSESSCTPEIFEKYIAEWGRIVIKPASGGSTVGVTITDDPREAVDALIPIWDIDTGAIVEKYIPGREFTAAVFDEGDGPFVLPLVEIRPRSGFYDYKSKYTSGASEYLCPAPVDGETADRMRRDAAAIHAAIGCATYSRVDFRVDDDGGVWPLELNTAPGMTSTSLVPKAAAAHGWSFADLIGRMIKGAHA